MGNKSTEVRELGRSIGRAGTGVGEVRGLRGLLERSRGITISPRNISWRHRVR